MSGSIVIGGGANGLATAITLAGLGHEVTLLEARSALGGRMELLPDTRTVQPWAVAELGIEVEWADAHPITRIGGNGTESITLQDTALQDWFAQVDSFRDAIQALSTQLAPDIRQGASIRSVFPTLMSALKLGRSRGIELARVGPLCAEDWLDESGIARSTQAALILPALRGSWMGPRSPSSALAVLFHHALAGARVKGGMSALLNVLQNRAKQLGVQVKTDTEVASIRIEDRTVRGVVLADDSSLDADLVVSTVGPRRTLLDLVPAQHLMPPEHDAIRHYRNRGIVACVQAEVSAPLWNGAAHVVLADDTVTLEKAFDDAKHRRLPDQPAIEVFQSAGSLQALVFGAACDLDGGWTEEARETLQSTVKRVLTDGGEADVITNMTLHTPADLEREYGLVGGHLFHGEFALDQLLCFRPHPSLSRYTTDIAGLRLGGCGVHPAGGFTLVQGVLAGR